jgi:hypothetical protein
VGGHILAMVSSLLKAEDSKERAESDPNISARKEMSVILRLNKNIGAFFSHTNSPRTASLALFRVSI